MSIYSGYTDSYILDEALNKIPDITVDQLNEFYNHYNTNINTVLSESNIDIVLESVAGGKSVDSFANKMGLKTSKSIDNGIKQTTKKAADIIKKEGLTKASKKKVKDIIHDFYEDIAADLRPEMFLQKNKDKLKGYDWSKLRAAAGLLLITVIINSIIASLLTLLLLPLGIMAGPQVATAILSIIIAPIVEEGSKQISIKGGFEKEFAALFNIYEASSYIIKMSVTGFPLMKAIIGRIKVVGMHLTTHIIQFILQDEKMRKLLKLKDDEESKKRGALIGNIVGILIHAAWNSGAVFSTKFQAKIFNMDHDEYKNMVNNINYGIGGDD